MRIITLTVLLLGFSMAAVAQNQPGSAMNPQASENAPVIDVPGPVVADYGKNISRRQLCRGQDRQGGAARTADAALLFTIRRSRLFGAGPHRDVDGIAYQSARGHQERSRECGQAASKVSRRS